MERDIETQKKELSDYKYALDQSCLVAITNAKGIIIHANDNFCKLAKYSREELIGQDHRIINSGYHSKKTFHDLWVTITNGKIWKGELKNKAKDGTFYWVDTIIVPFLDDFGKSFQYMAIRIDITNRKNAEEKYKLLFESLDQGFCIIEMIFNDQKKPIDYRFLEINEAFEKQSGLKNAVGKRMREFAPDHEEYWFEIFGKIALTNESVRFENRAEQLNRSYDVYAFQWGEPKNLQVAIIFSDITKRKNAEEQLLEANKELETFSFSVAHDLRAPLRSIYGYAEILNEDYEKIAQAERKQLIEKIKYNASKMGKFIDNLLSLSNLGRRKINFNKISMSVLTKEVIAEINTSISHKANILVDDLPDIMGDYSMLYQVMVNLISNAVKYSSKKEKPVVQISSEVKNGETIFSIKDNGAGFDMKYYEKLFSFSQRLHAESEFTGTGVGLSIAHRIITMHGGRIWAEGKVDSGATFNFSLIKK
ncbi:MAG: PAS domain S-box-containing protein [Mariniflexile sp.]|jgi:PAS domain S-box-containing protein